MARNCRVLPATVVALALAHIAGAQPPLYHASLIEGLSNSEGLLFVTSVSGSGVVGGTLHFSYGARAFAFNNGTLTQFGGSAGPSTWASRVNDAGTVVGELDEGGFPWPFVADAVNGVRRISPLGGNYGIAHGINDAGVIVGSASTGSPSGPYLPFIYADGIGAPLPLPPGATQGGAAAITSHGLIGGTAQTGEQVSPVIWNKGQVAPLPLPAGLIEGGIWALTDTGWTLGYGRSGPSPFTMIEPVLWHHGLPSRLPGLGGLNISVGGLSDSGQVVGSVVRADLSNVALMWIDGVAYPLQEWVIGPPDIQLWHAVGIDSGGRVVSWGRIGPELSGLFLLTPIPAPATMLPLLLALPIRRPRRIR